MVTYAGDIMSTALDPKYAERYNKYIGLILWCMFSTLNSFTLYQSLTVLDISDCTV